MINFPFTAICHLILISCLNWRQLLLVLVQLDDVQVFSYKYK
ncbi:hypothetical protein Patl1_05242 [Pistacia atlantica]|uniref:Uncharacterized protein n=1 Tax=Pistacia atlantica TaxID=434234 RepID=A0ACC1BST6_9ROSI|nr:hypothetical protein Patl1_05242 [Pistacia atlantica]